MSIKKLAKAINNLADAIRYHADAGSNTAAESFTVPKYEGKEVETALSAAAPGPLTPTEANYVDPYDTPPAEKVSAPGWQTLTVEELDKTVDNSSADPVDNSSADPVGNLPPAPPAPPADPVDNSSADPVGNSVEVDSAGLPWDERIHSGGKTKLADGTWRDKRGVEDSEREAIVSELAKVMAIPVPAPAVIEHTAPAAIKTLPEFVRAVTGAKLGNMMVTEAVKSVGLESITQLGARPDLIPAVAAELGL